MTVADGEGPGMRPGGGRSNALALAGSARQSLVSRHEFKCKRDGGQTRKHETLRRGRRLHCCDWRAASARYVDTGNRLKWRGCDGVEGRERASRMEMEIDDNSKRPKIP